jgi:hypothetical protein
LIRRVDLREGPAIQRRTGAQRDSKAQVCAGLKGSVELAQRHGNCEVSPVRGGVDIEQLLERGARTFELAGVVVRAPERLEDRALARLDPRRALEHDRCLRVMARPDQCLPALEQRVGALAFRLRGVRELG